MGAENSLLLEQNAPISIPQWEEIIRSIIMFSDKVWLHPSVKINRSLDAAISKHISNTFNQLVEAGFIQFYSLESDSADEQKNVSRVITLKEHMQLYNSIIEKVQNTTSFSDDGLPDPERTSRIVEKRNELWRYGIATILGSDISVTCRNINKSNIHAEISNRSLKPQLTKELFSAFEIQSLSHLSTPEIIDLRDMAQKYRKVLTELATKARTDVNSDISSVVEDEYRVCIEKINELATEAAGSGSVKKLVSNSILNIVGLVPLPFIIVAPITALVCGKDLLEFFTSRDKYGFVLYMNSLKLKSRTYAVASPRNK